MQSPDPFMPHNDVAIARLEPDGSLDSNFDGDGMFTHDPLAGGGDLPGAVASLEEGGFVVTGPARNMVPPGVFLSVARFAANGEWVSGWGPRGRGAVKTGDDIEVLADGRIVIAGGADGPAPTVVVRLLSNGREDPSFSGDGVDTAEAFVDLPKHETGSSVAVQPSGRIVVGATGYNDGGTNDPDGQFGLLRFLAKGGLDPYFAGDGRQQPAFEKGAAQLTSIDLQGQRIVAVGGVGVGSGNSDFALAVYDGRVADPPAPLLVRAPNKVPDSNIRRPSLRPLARRPVRFRGTAADDGRVAKVEVALLRVRSPKGRPKRCLWLRNRRSRLARRGHARRGGCARFRRFVRADGTTRWHLRLRRGLPRGRYLLYSRATDDRGTREKRFSVRDRNRLSFTVRPARSSSPRP
jgi:uncharacterized delta-60 repeat protein